MFWDATEYTKNITPPGAATALQPVWFWTAQSNTENILTPWTQFEMYRLPTSKVHLGIIKKWFGI